MNVLHILGVYCIYFIDKLYHYLKRDRYREQDGDINLQHFILIKIFSVVLCECFSFYNRYMILFSPRAIQLGKHIATLTYFFG